jgi:hypothetical protein
LQRRIGDAGAGNLSALRGEVLATVAATQALAQQANVTGTPPFQTAEVALQRASEGARVSVTSFMHDYYDRHEFDHLLTFTSNEDREEYRKREEERKKAMDTAMAEHTPQGDLKAANLSLDQLNDAGAHGADKSDIFQSWKKSLTEKRDHLAGAINQQEHATAASTSKLIRPDPLKDVKADPAAEPDALAGLRAAGVIVAPKGEGHGVGFANGQSATIGRQ